MNESLRSELLSKLIDRDSISSSAMQIKKNKYEFQSINKRHTENIADEITSGWEIDCEFKTVMRLRRKKSHDVYFEDQVWSLFAQLGFHTLNKDRNFRLPYDKSNPALSQQIDIFAKDDESVLLVECKAAKSIKKGDFKKELDAIKGNKEGLMKSIKALYPDSKLKIKYILATHNYALSEPDKERLNCINGIHFDSETIEYYLKMYEQIGLAARYQLLGSIFAGQEIPEMDNKIPAIQGKMGNHEYYAFSIEPEKLLKISYVLHRNKANLNMMPTYQRIIKKNRLKAIHNFIDEDKGYFPNSIVISIDSGNKRGKLEFQSTAKVASTISSAGILSLPKKYRSAYIIDGQHRLYGYANSKFKSTNTIPVVAFVDLDRSEQVKLFMQINENQKTVSKDLRNTLNADLLWTSPDLTEQIKALKSRIALRLGEDKNSALYNKISIGEDKKSITTQQIGIALSRGIFLGKVTKNKIEELGVFYKGDLDEAYDNLAEFLLLSLDYLKDSMGTDWEDKESIIAINKGVYAIIMILSDLTEFVIQNKVISDKSKPKVVFEAIKSYIDSIVYFFKDLDDETYQALKSAYGAGGDTKYWRTLQKYMRDHNLDFSPNGLDEYLQKEEKKYNTEAFELVREIENFFKRDFREKLVATYGGLWFKKGVPPKVGEEATRLAYQKNLEIEDPSKEISEWDCLTLIAYREIASKNWEIFKDSYTRPNEIKIPGGKDAKTGWMVTLERIRNKIMHTQYVTEEEHYFLEELYDWLIKKDKD